MRYTVYSYSYSVLEDAGVDADYFEDMINKNQYSYCSQYMDIIKRTDDIDVANDTACNVTTDLDSATVIWDNKDNCFFN